MEGTEASDNKPAFEHRQEERVTQYAAALQAGHDRKAFEMLYQMEVSKVYTRVRLLMKSDVNAEAIMQEAFLSVYTRINELPGAAVFESWLMKQTRRVCLDQYRNTAGLQQPEAAVNAAADVAEDMEDSYLDFRPQRDMDPKTMAVNLQQILDTLSVYQNICLQMREYDGLSYQEIAEELSLPISSVKEYTRQARKIVMVEVINKNLYTAAPLAFFYWMLRQSPSIYVCEPALTVSLWEKLAANTGKKGFGSGNRPKTDGNNAGDGRAKSKTAIIIVAAVAGVLILGIGGFFIADAVGSSKNQTVRKQTAVDKAETDKSAGEKKNSDQTSEEAGDAQISQNTTAQEIQTDAVDDQKNTQKKTHSISDTLGSVKNNIYENEFFKIKFTPVEEMELLPDKDRDENNAELEKLVKEAVDENPSLDTDMFENGFIACMGMKTGRPLQMIQINCSSLKAMEGEMQDYIEITEDTIIDSLKDHDTNKKLYEEQGYSDVKIETEEITFLGEKHPSSHATMVLKEGKTKVDMHIRTLVMVQDGYVAYIAVSSTDEDSTVEILDRMEKLN